MVSCYFQLSSQTYGNEWTNMGRSSFSIVNDGIYKIDYNTLVSQEFHLVQSIKQLSGFGRERQIPIHIVWRR